MRVCGNGVIKSEDTFILANIEIINALFLARAEITKL
jgi:hypothetical protein